MDEDLIDQEYTVTDAKSVYKFPKFVSDPANCEITYTYNAGSISDAVSFDSNMNRRKFKFYYDKDLKLAGTTHRDYTITVIGKVGNVRVKTLTKSFNLRVHNPCVNPNYVQLTPPI